MQIIAASEENTAIEEGILFAAKDWFFPIVGGIPRLTVEAFRDYEDFFRLHLPDYSSRRQELEQKYPELIAYIQKKNKRTKDSFSLEWSLYDYQQDRTWEAGKEEMLRRFLEETDQQPGSLAGMMIFDAGCGNGQLDSLIAGQGAIIMAMDISLSIERAYRQNTHPDAWYLQGDLQFPPIVASLFDLVHCSGVLHHTNDTELSFKCVASCVRPGGKLSVWLYHPRADRLHNLFNRIRSFTSRLPLRWQYRLLYVTALPVSYIWKRLKGNRQNKREMMIALMDQLSPEFRREHTPDETAGWYAQQDYHDIRVTTSSLFGFNMIGTK
jgi:SAM-dependent methyltransferase